jgi:FMN-dependent NADH-azoreductase
MENYLLIDNGHGHTICDISDKKIPWDLTDETKFTEKELCKHLEKSIEMVDRIFTRIDAKDGVITSYPMFGRTTNQTEKKFIKDVFLKQNSFIKNKKKLWFVFT